MTYRSPAARAHLPRDQACNRLKSATVVPAPGSLIRSPGPRMTRDTLSSGFVLEAKSSPPRSRALDQSLSQEATEAEEPHP